MIADGGSDNGSRASHRADFRASKLPLCRLLWPDSLWISGLPGSPPGRAEVCMVGWPLDVRIWNLVGKQDGGGVRVVREHPDRCIARLAQRHLTTGEAGHGGHRVNALDLPPLDPHD
ncbi:hypothetical protein [Methylobacterium planeticum]|uniref:Uncharacterized protein n=1 Tax=Methylobacterium planeticum TaxID=2615211 RepID=A0A6N6ML75_9HYPH|nr:hypothetical protein [Methylobacterium planeticum]KAB1070769.1 hypothetical protein F6X51_21595 [Methylobacterium planeticum]